MAPLLNADVAALQKELIKYQPYIPALLEADTPLYGLLEKVDHDPVSDRATRIPLLVELGGAFQQANMDNADLGGGGTGPLWKEATLQPIYFTHQVSLSSKSIYATQGQQRAVKNPFQETIRVTLKQFKAALDMLMNTGGNGVLGTITSVSTNDLTLTTDGFKEELFYYKMPVQVFNSALTTDRGSTTVTKIDREGHIVTVAAAPGGTVATDKLLIEGLAAPVTIQSSLFGLQYHQSDAASGLWMNLDRAVLTQIRTPSVNANSANLSTAHIRRIIEKIRENVGDEPLSNGEAKLIAYCHGAQADAYEAQALTISTIIKQPTGNQNVDLLFNNRGGMPGMNMSGVPVRKSIHADRTRIDFLCLNWWGKVVATDTGFYKNPADGSYLFPVYRSGGDGLVSSWFFYYLAGMQVYNRNPLCGGYIKTLNVPSLY